MSTKNFTFLKKSFDLNRNIKKFFLGIFAHLYSLYFIVEYKKYVVSIKKKLNSSWEIYFNKKFA